MVLVGRMANILFPYLIALVCVCVCVCSSLCPCSFLFIRVLSISYFYLMMYCNHVIFWNSDFANHFKWSRHFLTLFLSYISLFPFSPLFTCCTPNAYISIAAFESKSMKKKWVLISSISTRRTTRVQSPWARIPTSDCWWSSTASWLAALTLPSIRSGRAGWCDQIFFFLPSDSDLYPFFCLLTWQASSLSLSLSLSLYLSIYLSMTISKFRLCWSVCSWPAQSAHPSPCPRLQG